MAEVIGLAASIVQIAGAGASLSKALYSYVGSAAGADQQIADIAGDVEITSNALNNVGEVFRNESSSSIVSKAAVQDASNLIKRCESVFASIQCIIEKRRKPNKDGTKALSLFGKLYWPLKEQKIQVLQSRLESLKNSLILLFHVIQLANGQARGDLEKNALEKERDTIRQLYQRQQDSLQALQSLENKLNLVSLDDQETLHGSEIGSLSREPTINMMLNALPIESGKDSQRNQNDLLEHDNELSTDESDMSDKDGSDVDDAELLTSEELSACADQVQKLLRKISVLQKSLTATRPSRLRRNRVQKLYRRFCYRFESNLTSQSGTIGAIAEPTPVSQAPAKPLGLLDQPQVKVTSGVESQIQYDFISNPIKEGDERKLQSTKGTEQAILCRVCSGRFRNIPDLQHHFKSNPSHTWSSFHDTTSFTEDSISFGLDDQECLNNFDFDSFLNADVGNEHSNHPPVNMVPAQLGPMNMALPPRIDEEPQSEYTKNILLLEVARRRDNALKLGLPLPSEEYVQADMLRDYQMGLMVLNCRDRPGRKGMCRAGKPGNATQPTVDSVPGRQRAKEDAISPEILPPSKTSFSSYKGDLSHNIAAQPGYRAIHSVSRPRSSAYKGISGSFKDLGNLVPLSGSTGTSHKSEQPFRSQNATPTPWSFSQQSEPTHFLPGTSTMADSPLFVNPKQFDRITKRRLERHASQVQFNPGEQGISNKRTRASDNEAEGENGQEDEVDEGTPEISGEKVLTTGLQSSIPNSKPLSARKRTKSGCLTCRKRRIFCDEGRPTCTNCLKGKRQCQGYNQHVVFKSPIGDWPNSTGVVSTIQFHNSALSRTRTEMHMGMNYNLPEIPTDVSERKRPEGSMLVEGSMVVNHPNIVENQSDRLPTNVDLELDLGHKESSEADAIGQGLRKRAACIFCRKKKLKCDRVEPTCGHCSSVSIDCEYETARKKSGVKRGYNTSLETRLAQVEKLRPEVETQPSQPSQPSPSSSHTIGASSDRRSSPFQQSEDGYSQSPRLGERQRTSTDGDEILQDTGVGPSHTVESPLTPFAGSPASPFYSATSPAYAGNSPTSPCSTSRSPSSVESTQLEQKNAFVIDDEVETEDENLGRRRPKRSRKREEVEDDDLDQEDLDIPFFVGNDESNLLAQKRAKERERETMTKKTKTKKQRLEHNELEDIDIVDVLLGQWTTLASPYMSMPN